MAWLRVELFEQIRRDRRDADLSIRELAQRHHVHRHTVRQALANAIPPPRKTYPRGRDREESERFIALRSHYGFDSFFCRPGIEGAHEKGGVEDEIGPFHRPAARCGDRRPAHLQRAHPGNRHRVLPAAHQQDQYTTQAARLTPCSIKPASSSSERPAGTLPTRERCPLGTGRHREASASRHDAQRRDGGHAGRVQAPPHAPP